MINKIYTKVQAILKHHYIRLFSYPSFDINEGIDYNDYWIKRRGTRGLLLGEPQKMRLDRLVEIIKGTPKIHSVVDVGGADGSFVYFLKQKVAGITSICCVDSSEYALENATHYEIPNKLVDLSKKEQLELIPEADLLYALEVLEHIPNSEVLLREMYLKAKVMVVFSFPNTGFITYRIRLLLGKFPMQWVVHPTEHYRFWTVTDARWWLKAQGYKNYKVVPHRGIPVLNKIFPNLFSADIFVVLTKD